MRAALPAARQRGFGIVEVMVGILIGLLVVLVIYNLFSAAERYKRLTVGASDAQVTGLFSQFVVSRDISGAGSGMGVPGPDPFPDLFNCTQNEAGVADWSLRPIPVLITDKGSPDGESESFITVTSASPHVMWPVDFTANGGPASDFVVQSPTGFSSPTPDVQPYRVIVMMNDGTGRCTLTRVTKITAGPDLQGRVTLAHDPVALTYQSAFPARLLNLGPENLGSRQLFDVQNGQLRTTDLYGAAPANPLAQNIVLMKAQYGVDTNGDQAIDCWTPATTPALSGDPCGNGVDYSDTAIRNLAPGALRTMVNSILAVRLAVVVRSDEPDLKDNTLVGAARAPVVLFNCAANDATCQSRIVLPTAACPAPYYNPPNICDYIRYRTYETVIPLRNTVFTATLPP